jgi:hypothetical protein
MAIKETNTIFGAIKQYHDEIIKPKIKEIVENAVEKDNEILVSLQEASDKLSEELAKEVAIREVAEHNLNVRVDEETLARITRDIEITNYLDSEIARLTKKSEDELKEGLYQEENKRAREYLTLHETIANEANLRIVADERIYTRLDDEEAARKQADKDNLITLRNEIDGRVSAERKRAVEEEVRLGTYTDTQIIKLNNKLDKKFTDLFEEEKQVRSNADNKETELRENADKKLHELILAEFSRSIDAESTISANLATEITSREQANTILTTNLTTEISERKAADLDITNNLNKEITNRQNADSALEEKLTTKINTDISALNSASKEYVEDKIKAVQVTITDNKNTIDSNIGTPSVPAQGEEGTENYTPAKAATGIYAVIEKEIQDRIVADNTLDLKVDQEISDRTTAIQDLSAEIGRNINQLSSIVYETQQNLVDEGITRAQAISSIRTENELLMTGIKARLTDVETKSEASVAIVTDHTNKLQNINLVIPTEANLANKLADKAYVENLIATESSVFIGTFNTLEEIQKLENIKNNSYVFHKTENSYDRYKYSEAEKAWKFEYSLNNITFTAEQ